MRMLLSHFPEEIVEKYNIKALAVDSWVYIEIRKGRYGLKQAGLLANNCYKSAWHLLVTIPSGTHLNYGCIKHGQSLSPS
jgi:hypothetical protein